MQGWQHSVTEDSIRQSLPQLFPDDNENDFFILMLEHAESNARHTQHLTKLNEGKIEQRKSDGTFEWIDASTAVTRLVTNYPDKTEIT